MGLSRVGVDPQEGGVDGFARTQARMAAEIPAGNGHEAANRDAPKRTVLEEAAATAPRAGPSTDVTDPGAFVEAG